MDECRTASIQACTETAKFTLPSSTPFLVDSSVQLATVKYWTGSLPVASIKSLWLISANLHHSLDHEVDHYKRSLSISQLVESVTSTS